MDQEPKPQEDLGRAILDLKEQFPKMTASQRADWLDKFSGIHPSKNGNGNGKNT